MDFTFSLEQDALRAAVRGFVAREGGRELVRGAVEDEARLPDEVWSKMAALGWTGADLGLVDLVVVQEELGRAAFPGPYLSSLQGALAARHLGFEAQGRGTLAVEELGATAPLDAIATTAAPDGSLDGLKPTVLDGDTADWALVVARDATGLGAYLVEAPEAEPVPGLDVTRRLTRLDLRGRPARRVGPPGDQTELLQRVIDDVAVALCAETVGACEAALEMAVEYAKVRVQFDRPIGTFQAIRHKIVDMLHNLELARVGTHYAAWASDTDDPDRAVAAAMAKGFVGEAAVMVTSESIQVHGAVGFTWDVDCHLHYRRVKQNDVLFGRAAWYRQRLADLVLTENP